MIIQIYEIQTPEEANRCIDLGVDHIGSVLLSGQDWKQPNILEVVKLTRQSRSKSSIIPLFNDFDTLSKVLDYYKPDFIHFCESLVDECGKETNLTQYIELQHTIKERNEFIVRHPSAHDAVKHLDRIASVLVHSGCNRVKGGLKRGHKKSGSSAFSRNISDRYTE